MKLTLKVIENESLILSSKFLIQPKIVFPLSSFTTVSFKKPICSKYLIYSPSNKNDEAYAENKRK